MGGLPTLEISFKAAAQRAAARSKRGAVAVIVRDTKAQGLHTLTGSKQIPSTLGKTNVEYISRAFEGSDRGTPSRVYAAVVAPTAADGESHIPDALTLLAPLAVDYLAGPSDITEAECAAVGSWVKARRGSYSTVKAVLPSYAGNDMGLINFATSDIKVGSDTYTAAQYCSRIAGILAGISTEGSGTYAPLPEVTSLAPMTDADANTAINGGKLILLHDGVKAKIARAVNSLTTVPVTGKEDWKKIKIVETMDLISAFLRTTIEDEYQGQYNNTYLNKLKLVVAIGEYLSELERLGLLEAGRSWVEIDVDAVKSYLSEHGVDVSDMDEAAIKQADTGSKVYIACGGRIVDAMEDFVINYTNL